MGFQHAVEDAVTAFTGRGLADVDGSLVRFGIAEEEVDAAFLKVRDAFAIGGNGARDFVGDDGPDFTGAADAALLLAAEHVVTDGSTGGHGKLKVEGWKVKV